MGIIDDRDLKRAREYAADLLETSIALRSQWNALGPQLAAIEAELDALTSIADASNGQLRTLFQYRQQKAQLIQQRNSYKTQLQTFIAKVENAGYEAELQAEIDKL